MSKIGFLHPQVYAVFFVGDDSPIPEDMYIYKLSLVPNVVRLLVFNVVMKLPPLLHLKDRNTPYVTLDFRLEFSLSLHFESH